MWISTRGGRTARALVGAAGLLFASAGLSWALQHSGRVDAEPKSSALPRKTGASSGQPSDVASKQFEPVARVAPSRMESLPRAVARAEGTALPGSRIRLDGSGSEGTALCFRWVQTRGKTVSIDDPDRPVARFVVPAEPGPLGFTLVVAGPNGSDTTEVTTTGEDRSGAAAAPTLRADAGDDQIALVGRQVTLNGARSEPRGRLGYRWVQTGGPKVRFKLEDGYIYSFVPAVPGIFRFALVVASGSEISAADEVIVTVGAAARSLSGGGKSAEDATPAEATVPTQELARSSLSAIRRGAESAETLARVFDDAADRMDLYRSYADTYSEMSRRLEDILPEDPAHRVLWVERVFNPLTARTLDVMRAEGLDLRVPEGQSSPLTAPQKAAMAEHFRLIAEGFRSAALPR